MSRLGMSNFARNQHQINSGNSYTLLSEKDLIQMTADFWKNRTPGLGETGLSRKVLVPLGETWSYQTDEGICTIHPVDHFVVSPRIPLQIGLPVCSKVMQRQVGEAPFVKNYVRREDAIKFGWIPSKPKFVNIVCYHKDALLENGGERSGDFDWEIVCILASLVSDEPMQPLAMARNYLSKAGGTFTDYSALEFAESIWYWSTQSGISVME